MKKKNESGAESSATSVSNQTANLAQKFEGEALSVLMTFNTLFEFEMDDAFRGAIYMLRQDVKDLIEAAKRAIRAKTYSETISEVQVKIDALEKIKFTLAVIAEENLDREAKTKKQ